MAGAPLSLASQLKSACQDGLRSQKHHSGHHTKGDAIVACRVLSALDCQTSHAGVDDCRDCGTHSAGRGARKILDHHLIYRHWNTSFFCLVPFLQCLDQERKSSFWTRSRIQSTLTVLPTAN